MIKIYNNLANIDLMDIFDIVGEIYRSLWKETLECYENE